MLYNQFTMFICLLEQAKGDGSSGFDRAVRKDQHGPDLVILDWTVEPIVHGVVDRHPPSGLFRFTGMAIVRRGIDPGQWS